MKSLSKGRIWLLAMGQLGWAMLSGLISNWLVYFYQPDEAAQAAGQTIFIPQGRVLLSVFTIIGAITALGRIFDAVTDPWIASFIRSVQVCIRTTDTIFKMVIVTVSSINGYGILCTGRSYQYMECGMAFDLYLVLLFSDHCILHTV